MSTIVNIDHNAIRTRAYELWLVRGCPLGSAENDWLLAEQELRESAAFKEGSPVEEPAKATRTTGESGPKSGSPRAPKSTKQRTRNALQKRGAASAT